MKRHVSLFLALSFLFSCAACKKSDPDETKDSDPTVLFAQTEKNGSDPGTEDSGDAHTTDASSDPATESTAETSAEPEDPLVFHDLTYLPVTIENDYDYFITGPVTYIAHDEFNYDETWKATDYPSTTISCDSFSFEGAEYADLEEKVNGILLSNRQKMEEEYSQYKEKLKSRDMKFDEYNSFDASQKLCLFRADSEILSFYERRTYYYPDGDYSSVYEEDAYSFYSDSLEPVRLDDVVTDRGALAELIKKYLQDNPDMILGLIEPEWVGSQITDGTIPFAIGYDGIYLFPDPINCGEIKVSAFAHPELFHMEFFEHTPKHFSLFDYEKNEQSNNFIAYNEFNIDEGIYWDFNGDGVVDVLRSIVTDSDSKLVLGDHGVSFGNGLDIYLQMVFVETDAGQFVYVGLGVLNMECFRIEKDLTITRLTIESGLNLNPTSFSRCRMIDPDRFTNYEDIFFHSDENSTISSWGANAYCQASIGADGIVSKDEGFYRPLYYNCIIEDEISGKEYDIETGTAGNTVTVSAGDYVAIEWFDAVNGKLLLRVFTIDADARRYVLVENVDTFEY